MFLNNSLTNPKLYEEAYRLELTSGIDVMMRLDVAGFCRGDDHGDLVNSCTKWVAPNVTQMFGEILELLLSNQRVISDSSLITC